MRALQQPVNERPAAQPVEPDPDGRDGAEKLFAEPQELGDFQADPGWEASLKPSAKIPARRCAKPPLLMPPQQLAFAPLQRRAAHVVLVDLRQVELQADELRPLV